ncbi:hypothetical protein DMC25_23105 [Caulobacter sp. D4A]|uniref:hypothetical protein n=1 Tax=unclassified Caulobacter TaxID=2648921 RepID=UPI000D731D45|nr:MULTISPECIES: hypothetical protein [unclassified Caulobacter]PXA77569.1 hypothetical protein DMC25_23105 [Caulobacter sp. D4A]PXA96163.1 hypothetical protein DMC18_02225 [Caulobacter sp. D5]
MTCSGPRRRDGADRPLAATFRRNAASFHLSAEHALERHPEGTRYHLAIAIELALKAYLLDRGITDDWNRIQIRHDLVKALRSARRAGFRIEPAGLADLAALLSPFYQTHTIARMPAESIAAANWAQACQIVRTLIDAVEAAATWGEADGGGDRR